MSEENVELVREALELFNAYMRGGVSSQAVAQLGDPKFEFHWHDERTMPDLPQHLHGPQAFVEFWEQMRSAWDDLTLEALEFVEVPPDRVLTLTLQTGRGRESQVPINVHSFHLWTIREGKISAIGLFRHRADALEAAGLSE